MTHFPPVEGGVGQLLEQVALMPMEITAVDMGGFGIRGRLPAFLMIFLSFRPLRGMQGT